MTSRMAKAGWAGQAPGRLAVAGQVGKRRGGASCRSGDRGTDASGLTVFQMENGVGPITEVVQVGEIDHERRRRPEDFHREVQRVPQDGRAVRARRWRDWSGVPRPT